MTPDRAGRTEARALDEVLTNARDVLIILDAGGNISYVSPRGREMFGYLLADLLGRNLDMLSHPSEPIIGQLATWQTDGQGELDGDRQFLHATKGWVRLDAFFEPLTHSTLGSTAVTIRSPASEAEPDVVRRELAVEAYCNRLSARLLKATTSSDVFFRIQEACADIGEMTGSHSVAAYLERPEMEALQRIAHWVDGSEPDYDSPSVLPVSLFPDWIEALLSQSFAVNDISHTQYEAIRGLTKGTGLSAFLSVPFQSGSGRALLALGRRHRPHRWRLVDAQLVRTASAVLSTAMTRSRDEQLWANTYRSGPTGFSMRTVDGYLLECNKQYRDLCHLAPGQDSADDFYARLHPDDHVEFRSALNELLHAYRHHVGLTARLVGADGTVNRLRFDISEISIPGHRESITLTAVRPVTDNDRPTIA